MSIWKKKTPNTEVEAPQKSKGSQISLFSPSQDVGELHPGGFFPGMWNGPPHRGFHSRGGPTQELVSPEGMVLYKDYSSYSTLPFARIILLALSLRAGKPASQKVIVCTVCFAQRLCTAWLQSLSGPKQLLVEQCKCIIVLDEALVMLEAHSDS